MRRFVTGGNRRKDVENAIGSPAGVEMKDYAGDDAHAQLDSLVYSTQSQTDGSRVVSPTNVRSESPESGGDVSTGSNFNFQETLDQAARTQGSTGPDTPSRLGSMIDTIYRTPNRFAGQQDVPMSAASSAGPGVQFNDIGFSPDFDNMENDPQTISRKSSSDVGDYNETFGDQIDALNDLLATPGKVLGDLADTLISPDDDDSVDQELEDLEGNSRLLSQELSQVGWYTTGVSKQGSTSKQLFSSPEIKRTGSTDSDYDHLFTPSPAPQSKPTPSETPSTAGDGTPSTSSKKQKQDDSNSSFLPSMFGFRKTPTKPVQQSGIGRTPDAKEDAASEASQSAVSQSPSTSGSMFQALANFSAMVGDTLTSPTGKNQSPEILRNQSHASSTSQPSLVGENILFDAGSPPSGSPPSKQLATNLETVSPIRRDPVAQSSLARGQLLEDFDANTDTMQQPLINKQQQQHVLPRTPDRQKMDDNLRMQSSYPGRPAPANMMSPPVIYADETTTDEEEGAYFVHVDKNPDPSVVSQYTQDLEVGEKIKEPKAAKEKMTTRQIACLCGFMVVVIVFAVLIALLATNALGGDPETSGSQKEPPIIIDLFTPSPTREPTRRPTQFPTPSEPTLPPVEEFDIGYNIRIADGNANSIPSSDYTPDLIESMDRLSVGVLSAVQEGKDPSTLYERRRLSALLLPSTIVSIVEDECPNANGRDRCERIIAGLSLLDDSNVGDAFRNTLQQEVTSGGLQFFLRQVNPNSPISILDPSRVPGMTPAPSIAILPPTTPSSVPGGPTLPTRSPALQPTLENPSQTPNPATQPSPGQPTRNPALQPSPQSPTPGAPQIPPTPNPASRPTPNPTPNLTSRPTANPAPNPTPNPTSRPTPNPTPNPTSRPTPLPTSKPTLLPTPRPTPRPTDRLTSLPSSTPTVLPIFKHTPVPTLSPSKLPTMESTVYDLLVSKSFDGGAALRDSATPQHDAFIWLLGNQNIDKYDAEKLVQRYVMATLYFSTDGESWLNNQDWLTDDDECVWFSKAGLGSCGRGGKLENLELDYNNLNGILPEELGLLSNSLQRIVLHGGPNESLDGSIPTTIGHLTNLRLLFMPNNSMRGPLPSEIGNLTLLQQINLSDSRLEGSLPSEVGRLASLNTFDISGNEFTGELPSDIGLMDKLNKLHLQNNRFAGSIPSTIGQIRRLQRLEAYGNSFEYIPSEIGMLAFCETIELQDNSIQGSIPKEIGELRRLRLLDLGNNSLTGTIPTELGKLKELKLRLSLASNQIRGSIPTELGGLDNLRIIDLRKNRLSGNIPEELSGMNSISTIHLDNNNLDGVIPDKVCTLYRRTFPEFSADCTEFDDNCPCCTTCCVGNQCTCRYKGTHQEYLCYSRTAGGIEP